MDPFEKPSNPNAPGPPVSSSQESFQFTRPFGAVAFGQSTTSSMFGQNSQFGNRSIVAGNQKPPNEPIFNNPFASAKSTSSIFGGRTEELRADSGAVPSPIFGGHVAEQTAIKTSTVVTQTTTLTVFPETHVDIALVNVPAEQQELKRERKRESKHPGLNALVKNRIRSLLSGNRQEEEDEELKEFQEMKESLLQKLAARKLEKKRKSADSNDGSPGKVTKEDKALYFTLPNETFTKSLIKEHFAAFGDLSRIYLNPTKNHCIVHFARHEDAVKAYENGSLIKGCTVRLFWRNILRSKKKSESSKEATPDGKKTSVKKRLLTVDPEVQDELAAMGGLDKYRPLHLSAAPAPDPARVLNRTSRKEALKPPKRESSHRPGVVSKEPDQPLEKNNDAATNDVFIEATTGARELIAIMKTSAATLEDRLRILEARDKLIRLGQVKQCDLAHAKKTIGACPDMCPEKERLLRETRRQVSFYEMDDSSKPSRMNPALAVKQYARSSADQEEPLPHELRPLPVMVMTMSYLLHCIADLCDRPGENLAEWYHFLWDRTRSIRKEITQQELCDLESVQLVEQCARFHIHCCARLVAEDVSVFDHRINTENLTKCLQTLKHMYYDLWVKHNLKCPNEPEFMSYFLLLNLNNGSVMWELEQLREDVLQTREIDFAAKMYMAIDSNNFVRFFRLVRSASYLTSCLAIRYFYQVRTLALRTHIKALNARSKSIPYPLATLSRELAFEDLAQGEQFCAHHGLSVDHSQSDMAQVLFSRNTFRIATTVFAASRSHGLVESKRNGSVGQVIAGGSLPPRTFENHVPYDSFDANGYLKQSAWHAVDQGMIPGDLNFEEDLGHVSEKDSSATPSEIDDVAHGADPTQNDPQPIITEPAEETSQPPTTTSGPPIPTKTALPDIIAPVIHKKPIAETKPQPSSSGVESTGTFSFSQPSRTRAAVETSISSPWMSERSTTSFKSIFGQSTKSFNSSVASEIKSSVQSPLFSKTSVATSTTNIPSFGKASTPSSFAEAASTSVIASAMTPTFSAATTNSTVGGASTTPSFGGLTTTSSFGGSTTSIFGGAITSTSTSTGGKGVSRAFMNSISPFRGPVTSDSLSGATASSAFVSKPSTIFGGTTSTTKSGSANEVGQVGLAAVKSDPKAVAANARAQVPKISEEEKNRVEAESAATKKKAEAQETEEKLRARLLENHVTRIAEESFNKFIRDELRKAAEESIASAKEAAKKEKELREKRAFELSETLMTEILLEELEELAAEELNVAIQERERAIQRLTAKYFRRWLEKTRLSLSRKRAIENFPAGVNHLSLKEHAERWGLPSLSHIQDFVKQGGFHVRGIPKLVHSWTSLSSLVGKEVMLRYHDQCRRLRWKHSSEVTFKAFLSVSGDLNDRSTRVAEWFVRNPQQLKHGCAFEDSRLGVIRYVTTYQLAPDQIVHSSLQLVRGNKAVQNRPELVAGTSAILFIMNLSENIQSCRDRLEMILDSLADLPAPPIVAVIFGQERALDAVGLKTLVLNLGLFKKLQRAIISDYKVLYLKEDLDLQAVDCELTKALSYTAQRWCPSQQFTVKPFRTVLMGAFDMFFISLKCSKDRDQPNFKSINDPQILAELCNEFLKYICAVLIRSRRESDTLCAPEVWPNIFKGMYSRFHDHPSYERHVASLLSRIQLPKLNGWPPNDPQGLKTWLLTYESIVSQSSDLIDRWSKVSSWPQVLEDIPWIEVFKVYMEKKFQDFNMTELCGTELYVIIGSKRLEKLHNDPWWKHSRRLHMYLSKFEKQADDTALVDDNEQKKPNEPNPPLKRRCFDEGLLHLSVSDDEITQIIEDHQLSLRSHESDSTNRTDDSEPRMSKLEMYIDSLQSRLGIGPYSSAKANTEPEKVESPKRTVPVPLPDDIRESDIPEEHIVRVEEEKSREAVKNKMKSILEATRKIVAPLQLPTVMSKRRELVRDYLRSRGKGDSAAVKTPLSVLNRSNFVERSRKETEKRLNFHKRYARSESEESSCGSEREESSCDETSQSDSAFQRCKSRKRTSSDRSRSSFSDESLSSVEAYSVTSDEERWDNNDNQYEESVEDDNYNEVEESIDCAVAVQVIRSSSDERELVEDEEENFGRADEDVEEEDFNDEDHGRRDFSESDIKISDDDETFNMASEDHQEKRKTKIFEEEMEEDNYEKTEEEQEKEGYEERDRYGGEDVSSDVQEISSDE